LITIRPYTSADWSSLCAIHDAARLDELRLSVGSGAFLTLEQTAESEGLFLGRLDVAERDGQIVGFVAYTPTDLTWLYVAPKSYRAGVGRVLLRHAIANAGPVFRTEVLEGNIPATNLYLSEGFRIIERKTGRLEGNDAYAATGLILQRSRE
jgi:ribosomal protein S18 acetylase RimI-like enzyme